MRKSALLALAAATAVQIAPARADDLRLQTVTGAYAIPATPWRDLPFRTVVRQRYDYSCGSAALATLLTHHYGRPSSEEAVFRGMFERGDQELIRQRGFSLLDMQRYLADAGLTADGYRLTLTRLIELHTPAITMVVTNGYRHFVVVKGAREGQILVGDPSAGLVIYSENEFRHIWQGVTFVIHGEDVAGEFNREDEWRRARPPRYARLPPPRPIEPLTRDLPPPYQITPVTEPDP